MANQRFNNELPEKLLSIFMEAGFSRVYLFPARSGTQKIKSGASAKDANKASPQPTDYWSGADIQEKHFFHR